MNKRIILFLTLAMLIAGSAFAQNSQSGKARAKADKKAVPIHLASASIDSAADAAAIARMKHKMDSIRRHRPTVALVLAGGGAKGAAHVGALEYIEELGIPIDMVLGTSMGGLVGGLVAMGYSSKEIDTILTTTNWGVMLSDQVPVNKMSYMRRKYNETYFIRSPFRYESDEWERRQREDYITRKANETANPLTSSEMGQVYTANLIANLPDGYIYGYNVNNTINSLTVGYQDSMDFCDLPIPYCCVATDLVTMKAKYWTHGHLSDAMRSTMSIPFFFTPVRQDGRIYIDGGTRNNFPTDMARAMGADYIIGVDLSQPRTYSEISGMANLLMQCIALMGKDAFDNNLPLADVYIHPDMSGMNMMSFDSASIAECLHRGYVAAQSQAEGLDAILQKVGTIKSRPLNNTPGINIHNRKVVIGNVVYNGINPDIVSYFEKNSSIHKGHAYSSDDIEEELALMYGSGLFDQVSYSLYGDKEPFTLAFHCKRGPIHQFGFGLRFDTKTMLSAAFNIGFNRRKLSGFKADISAVIGNNPSATVNVLYAFLNGPSVGLNIHTRYQTIEQYSAQTHLAEGFNTLTSWYNTADLYSLTHSWRHGAIRLGVKFYVSPFERKTAFEPVYIWHVKYDTTQVGGNYIIDTSYYVGDTLRRTWNGMRADSVNNWDHFVVAPYFEATYDNTDDSYFPTKGINARFRYDYYIYHYCYPDAWYNTIEHIYFRSNNINAHIKAAIPVAKAFTILPSLWLHSNIQLYEGRIVEGIVPSWMESYIGGITPGRFYENQLPYIGYNMPHFFSYSHAEVVANIDFRWQIAPKDYISFTVAGFSTFAGNLDDEEASAYRLNTLTDYAFALQYGHKSFIGPILFNVHWSRYNQPSPWGVYLSAGFDF